jgi:hypothetical protein
MSEKIKDTLWGAAAAAGVLVLLQIFGLLNSLLVVLIVPAAIAGGVTSSYLRDKRISVGYERELNAGYEEAERNINSKLKADASEDSEEAERHATLGGSDATVSQPSGTELWQAQAKRKYEQEEAVLRAEKDFNKSMVHFVHRPSVEHTKPSDIRADLADSRDKAASLASYTLELEGRYGANPTPEEARRLSRLTKQQAVLSAQASLNLKWLTQAQFKIWDQQRQLVTQVFGEKVNLSSSTELRVWLDSRKRPEPQPFGVSHEGAEHLVAEWLKYLGEENVEVTAFIGDGGVDVETDDYSCQVKNYGEGGVNASEMRDLFGTATAAGKNPILFTSSRLTAPAEEFANATGIACVKYDSQRSLLTPLNSAGRNFLDQGHYE